MDSHARRIERSAGHLHSWINALSTLGYVVILDCNKDARPGTLERERKRVNQSHRACSYAFGAPLLRYCAIIRFKKGIRPVFPSVYVAEPIEISVLALSAFWPT